MMGRIKDDLQLLREAIVTDYGSPVTPRSRCCGDAKPFVGGGDVNVAASIWVY